MIYLYHATEGARLFQDGEPLPTERDGWFDSPDKAQAMPPTVSEATKQLGQAIVETVKRGRKV